MRPVWQKKGRMLVAAAPDYMDFNKTQSCTMAALQEPRHHQNA
jgi:hypothetical protein